MHEELWLTHLFNDYLAGPGNAALSLIGKGPYERPWENWLTMEILVVAILMLAALWVRSKLSAEKPGAVAHSIESIYNFIKGMAHDAGIHHGEKFVPYFCTIFIFILSMNLIGIIPTFESPTMFPYVPAGLAIVTFLYFNTQGFKANGLGYLKHLMGPVWWLAPLMIPIELISLFIRPLSLTVRLYGNMYAGEQVTLVFISLTKVLIPVIFYALHVFVSLVQAYVFTILTMIYVAGATAHDHHTEP